MFSRICFVSWFLSVPGCIRPLTIELRWYMFNFYLRVMSFSLSFPFSFIVAVNYSAFLTKAYLKIPRQKMRENSEKEIIFSSAKGPISDSIAAFALSRSSATPSFTRETRIGLRGSSHTSPMLLL